MEKSHLSSEDKKSRVHKPRENRQAREDGKSTGAEKSSVAGLQQQAGNRAVQRLLAQRSGGSGGAFDLDDDTASRINHERGGGQPVDEAAQQRMGDATGFDFSDVRVHTSPEANDLSQQLGAKAFTTGKDIYFRDGAYDPGSSSGQKLLAHEMTHVVQQGSGAVGGGGAMHVNAPGDAYEQQADSVAHSVTTGSAGVQLQEEDEEAVQMQEEDEEEVQMQEEDEEEEVQMQAMPEEEEQAE